jgi:pimeloyl-ACP methyl ester carboxylesterase
MMTEKTLSVQGIPLHYHHWKGKDPILLLHGWGSSGGRWQGIGERLAHAGYEVIMPDLPGFGKTPAPEEPWSVREYVEFVEDLIKKLGLKDPVCLAHSFGGRIVLKAHALEKELFSLYILCGAAGIKHPLSLRQKISRGLSRVVKPCFAIPPFSLCKHMARKVLYRIAGSGDYEKTKGIMSEVFQKVVDEDLSKHIPLVKKTYPVTVGHKRYPYASGRWSAYARRNGP